MKTNLKKIFLNPKLTGPEFRYTLRLNCLRVTGLFPRTLTSWSSCWTWMQSQEQVSCHSLFVDSRTFLIFFPQVQEKVELTADCWKDFHSFCAISPTLDVCFWQLSLSINCFFFFLSVRHLTLDCTQVVFLKGKRCAFMWNFSPLAICVLSLHQIFVSEYYASII